MAVSLVFMGTPDFSVPPLLSLHQKGFDIPLVITQPDRPQGRGRKMAATQVKKAALDLGLPVIQPEKINTPDVIQQIKEISPDFFVVVAFGQFLCKDLLKTPKYNPINIHASLLPAYRGSAPIHRSIINGEAKTGITTMVMDAGMDTGDMVLSSVTDIRPDDTAESLHDRLSAMGADLIVETLTQLAEGRVTPRPQDPEKATYAPMLSKNEGQIPWHKSARELDCFIRGMYPWPGAFTFISGKRLKVFKARALDTSENTEPGRIIECSGESLIVQAGEGSISILEIQGASGKRLAVADFLRGTSLTAGELLQ